MELGVYIFASGVYNIVVLDDTIGPWLKLLRRYWAADVAKNAASKLLCKCQGLFYWNCNFNEMNQFYRNVMISSSCFICPSV